MKHKIDHEQLKAILEQPTEDFFAQYDAIGQRYIFIDNGAKHLAVGHLDSVQDSNHFYRLRMGGQWRIYSPKLDNRLGVYTILNLLPSLGLEFDILLTIDEELSNSSAFDWVLDSPEKRYNWMFEFDRGGVDAVTYQYRNATLRADLEACNWRIGHGSYSDIADLDELGCCGINFGVGFHNYHNIDAYVIEDDYYKNLERFLTFWNFFSHKVYEYTYVTPTRLPLSISKNYKKPLTYYEALTSALTDDEEDELALRGWSHVGDNNGNGKALSLWDNEALCVACGDPECTGISRCTECNGNFHDNLDVFLNGICNNCFQQAIEMD